MLRLHTHIQGTPCMVEVTRYADVPPRDTWDSPDDYYGYVECEYELLDEHGISAPGLWELATPDDDARIQALIRERVEGEGHEHEAYLQELREVQ